MVNWYVAGSVDWMKKETAVKLIPLRTKMAAILADDNFKCLFAHENERILIPISLICVLVSPIDSNPALLQVTVRRRKGDKPLPEPILT